MNCQEVIELMQRYVDRDLDENETESMMRHIGDCPDCAAMLQRLKMLSSQLEQLPQVMPKFSLVDAILPALEKLEPTATIRGEQLVRTRSRRLNRWSVGKVSGVVALGLALVFLMITQLKGVSFSSQSKHSSDASALRIEASAADSDSASQGNNDTKSEEGSSLLNDQYGSSALQKVSSDTDEEKATVDDQTTEKQLTGSIPSSVEPRANVPSAQPSSSPEEPKFTSSEDQVTVTGKSDGSNEKSSEQAVPQLGAPEMGNGIMALDSRSADATQFAYSPNGLWQAIVEHGTAVVQIYNAMDGSLLFQSDHRNGMIQELTWNEESTAVTYIWTNDAGVSKTLTFELASNKETER
ncbi:MAG: zf-HC2 domain-containing protein [Candidatus Cohnella colombiensis]|uniref:Anti-sigma-W factor RsiW n=1 Tax=Candidatus Cohnella colombiensis TaxID=3121368 RepID=A0AA95EUD0_9BACL|nr:MAG: zf-HC2 domain-containing protein [Cohnella sp.]